MTKSIKKILLVVSIFFFNAHCSSQSFTTIIQGHIKGAEIDSLYIFKATEDYRANHITVPVVNGSFQHIIFPDHKEAYEIYLPSHPRDYIIFFAGPDTIQITLYPGYPEKNIVKGNELSVRYYKFLREADKKFFNPIDSAFQKIDSLQNRKKNKTISPDLTSRIKRYKERIDSLTQASLDYQINYIANHTTIHSYFWLYKSLNEYKQISQMPQFSMVAISKLESFYNRHAEKFPSHPYSSITNTQIQAVKQVRVGNRYRDFTAPDLQGNQQQLSDLINGKITLLNLWASWCGPCIRKSRQMVPIYKKYQGEKFTIIGVAREFDDISKLKVALEREEFPWRNLVEVDDKHNIWRKYDIPYSGGGMFLIDKNGEILAINPSAKEVQRILGKRL